MGKIEKTPGRLYSDVFASDIAGVIASEYASTKASDIAGVIAGDKLTELYFPLI